MSASSSYSGHVEPGGAPITRTVDAGGVPVQVRKLSVGPMDNNCYLLHAVDQGAALLIDAAAEPERILELADGVKVSAILTTHGHHDHWGALSSVAEATGAPVVHHPADTDLIGVDHDLPARDDLELAFGDASVRLIHTPGHTDGSVCALLEGAAEDDPTITAHLFSGDTLFPGGPGRTTTPEAFSTIMHSLRTRLFTLPDETFVYPGHGDDTTLGIERPHLDAWQKRGW